MKKVQRIISLALVCFLIFSLSVMSVEAKDHGSKHDRDAIDVRFKDSNDAAWAAEYINSMQARNVFTGYEDGTFRPNQPVTRVEAVVMAVRLMGLEQQAQQKDTRTALHFTDAKHIENKYPWAKGYLLVALENGLFDAAEHALQPEAGASRVWVSSLLVRALGLQDEALKQMTNIPSFKDVNAIPAGSIGYVNVAVQKGIVTGYPDGTFQPNKSVTRAEMAALLDRTNDGILDRIGAYAVSGVVTDITFNSQTTGNVYNGVIKIKNYSTNKEEAYSISSALLVRYNDKYIRADQIFKNDAVVLIVQNGAVKEAAIIDPQVVGELNVLELQIEAEFKGSRDAEFKYKNKHGKIEAKVKLKEKNSKTELKGNDAKVYMERLIANLNLNSAMTKDDVMKRVLAEIFPNENLRDLKEVEVEIRFADGKKVEVEWEQEHSTDKNSDKNIDKNIVELNITAEINTDRIAVFKYKNDRGHISAEIVVDGPGGKREIKGDEAKRFMEKLIADMNVNSATTKEDVEKQVMAALFTAEELKTLQELDIEIQFSNGVKIETQWED